jgi:hypothetical protein
MKSVYLDQNHWIYLAKDFWGDPRHESHKGIAELILRAVQDGEVRLPLSIIHFIETSRHATPDRRARLAEVFDLFSCGWFMAPWSSVIPQELRRSINLAFKGQHDGLEPHAIGRGFLFGMHPDERKLLESRFTGEQIAAFERLAALPGAIYDLLTFPNEEGRQRQNEGIRKIDNEGASSAESLRAKRKPHLVDVHRRAQYAGYAKQFQDIIIMSLEIVGKSKANFLGLGLEGLMAFWATVPSLDVDCELTLYRDRQWTRAVNGNDIRDIVNLVLSIPYCDVVLTEKFWVRAVTECHLAEKYNTVVLDDLSDLKTVLGRDDSSRLA